LQAQLIGGTVGPGEHRPSVIPHAKRGADFPESLAESQNFLFLIAHDFGLACELCLEHLQVGEALFEGSDMELPLLQEPSLVRVFGQPTVTSGKVLL
jgi:hypothetical protein